MASSTLNFLQNLNDHYGNLLLFLVAIVAAIITYVEYRLKRRPYVFPEIIFEKQNQDWYFHILLVNKGEYPSITRISNALLKIGDEEYPTVFKFEAVLSPGEKQKLAPIGHINESGRKKINGHEYRSNRVEISIILDSKSLQQKRYKYKTTAKYEVNVSGESPTIQLVKEEMI